MCLYPLSRFIPVISTYVRSGMTTALTSGISWVRVRSLWFLTPTWTLSGNRIRSSRTVGWSTCTPLHNPTGPSLFTPMGQCSTATGTAVILKQKWHFDEIFITECTERCHSQNFRFSQWWTFGQNDISMETFSALLAPCDWNQSVSARLPS